MNNQAAQTMPELPDSQYRGGNDVFGKEFPLYTADQMHQYARDYAASQTAGVAEPNGKLVGWWNGIMPDVTERSPYGPSVRWGADAEDSAHDIPLYDGYNPIHYRQPDALAAAPAASGGEANPSTCIHRFGHDGRVCLRCGWNFRENGDPPQPPAVASVSERARVMLIRELQDAGAEETARIMRSCDDRDDWWAAIAIRAIEQALTQQRGTVDWLAFADELEAFKPRGELGALHGAGMAFAYKDVAKTIRAKLATTTPQPSADAVRELVKRWRVREGEPNGSYGHGYLAATSICADELESLLSAASDHQQNAAQGGGEK